MEAFRCGNREWVRSEVKWDRKVKGAADGCRAYLSRVMEILIAESLNVARNEWRSCKGQADLNGVG